MDYMMELWREGSFTAKGMIQPSPNRCGIENSTTYRYEVRLFARRAQLNHRGFILDNRAVNLYWIMKWGSEAPKVLPSCEDIAAIALQDFRTLARKDGVKLLGLEVAVYGGTYSAVTARWGKVIASSRHPAMGVPTPKPTVEPIPDDDRVIVILRELCSRH